MRRQLELALQLGARQATGLELTNPLGVAALGNLARLLLLVFPFFHALGEAGFRVDESFSSITHDVIIRIGWLPFTPLIPGGLPAVECLVLEDTPVTNRHPDCGTPSWR